MSRREGLARSVALRDDAWGKPRGSWGHDATFPKLHTGALLHPRSRRASRMSTRSGQHPAWSLQRSGKALPFVVAAIAILGCAAKIATDRIIDTPSRAMTSPGSRLEAAMTHRSITPRPQCMGFLLAALGAIVPAAAEAYVGPGAGLTAIGTMLALLAALALAVVGFVWYPIKRLMSRKNHPEPGAAGPAGTDAGGE